jgi:predicted nucleic acid-binding protein
MKVIVSDTGTILHLTEAYCINLLQKAGKVYIPEMVNTEMKKLIYSWEKDRPEWIFVEPLLSVESEKALSLCHSGLIDIGEAEAIKLAQRLKADWFLTDDTNARTLANSLNIEVHGSLGIVLWAAAVGHVNNIEAEIMLDNLFKTSLWISKNIMMQAKKALEQIFQK